MLMTAPPFPPYPLPAKTRTLDYRWEGRIGSSDKCWVKNGSRPDPVRTGCGPPQAEAGARVRTKVGRKGEISTMGQALWASPNSLSVAPSSPLLDLLVSKCPSTTSNLARIHLCSPVLLQAPLSYFRHLSLFPILLIVTKNIKNIF